MKTKELKANRNNIETYLPVFRGFYGSYWDEPDFYGEAEHFNLPENFPFYDFVDWTQYRTDLCKEFTNIVESELSEFVERIDYQSLSCPKEYNFVNDSINCIIRPKKEAISKYIYDNKEAFTKYLKDHLSSRDGFISFHSNQFETWENETKKFKAFDKKNDNQGFNLGFVLAFICENENITEEAFYDLNGECSIGQYYNEEFDKIISVVENLKDVKAINLDAINNLKSSSDELKEVSEQVKSITKFVQENYMQLNVRELTALEFEEVSEAGIINIQVLTDSVMAEIENKTLKLAI